MELICISNHSQGCCFYSEGYCTGNFTLGCSYQRIRFQGSQKNQANDSTGANTDPANPSTAGSNKPDHEAQMICEYCINYHENEDVNHDYGLCDIHGFNTHYEETCAKFKRRPTV